MRAVQTNIPILLLLLLLLTTGSANAIRSNVGDDDLVVTARVPTTDHQTDELVRIGSSSSSGGRRQKDSSTSSDEADQPANLLISEEEAHSKWHVIKEEAQHTIPFFAADYTGPKGHDPKHH